MTCKHTNTYFPPSGGGILQSPGVLSGRLPVSAEVGEGERRETTRTKPLLVVLSIFVLGYLHLGGVEERVAVFQGQVCVTLKGVLS